MGKVVAVGLLNIIFISTIFGQLKPNNKGFKKLTPLMGWSSWNHYRININENLIKRQADAMVTTGMKKAGYEFINTDDGYFGGREANGNIRPHTERFPNGMKMLAAYIHSKGLKAGIYSEAGINTCASMWDKDTIGTGMGLYGHELQDLRLLLEDWGYDFLKVDWCGADKMGLDEQVRYTEIGNIIKQVKPGIYYNVCRWKFPGKWVTTVADSWRIDGDLSNTFKSVLHSIDANADLWMYAGPGHVNDMDMLQVGRGMSFDEDKAHFSMWCMMASPLMAGNDLTTMSAQTLSILTNKELIAINQDALVYQARRLNDYGDEEVWAKPLRSTMSGEIAVALLNRADEKRKIAFNIDSVGLNAEKGFVIRNIWENKTTSKQFTPGQEFEVAPHGIVVLNIKGTARPFNVFQMK